MEIGEMPILPDERDMVKWTHQLHCPDREKFNEAVNLLIEYRRTFPAFRSKNIGAPGSAMRQKQDDHISLEDQTDKLIKKVEGR